MLRSKIHDEVNKHLAILANEIDVNSSLNLLHLHIHSEQFFMRLLNLLYGLELESANLPHHNETAIDLIDKTSKVVLQVSSTTTRAKVKDALGKLDPQKYQGYRFRFLSISKTVVSLRRKDYIIPEGIEFDRQGDILDRADLLAQLGNLDIQRQDEVYGLVRKELTLPIDLPRVYSDLTNVIFQLYEESFADSSDEDGFLAFDIEKKIFSNQLGVFGKDLVEQNALYTRHVSNIYEEFDRFGTNKTKSVLKRIRSYYIASLEKKEEDADQNLKSIIQSIKSSTIESWADLEISEDRLEFAVGIVVVDAFIRCKILEKPN